MRKSKVVSPEGDYQEYLLKSLKDPKAAAAYLEAAIEEKDRKLLLVAMRNVVEANGGMTKVAKKANVSRPTLYRTLSEKGNPRFDNLTNLLDIFGLRIAIQTK